MKNSVFVIPEKWNYGFNNYLTFIFLFVGHITDCGGTPQIPIYRAVHNHSTLTGAVIFLDQKCFRTLTLT